MNSYDEQSRYLKAEALTEGLAGEEWPVLTVTVEKQPAAGTKNASKLLTHENAELLSHLVASGNEASISGLVTYRSLWESLPAAHRLLIGKAQHQAWKALATEESAVNADASAKHQIQPLEGLLDSFETTSKPYIEPEYRIRCRHFNTSTPSTQDRIPLCHAKADNGVGYARGHYTNEAQLVTCKRCLKSLAKQVIIAASVAIRLPLIREEEIFIEDECFLNTTLLIRYKYPVLYCSSAISRLLSSESNS